jgi:two-component system, LytTR family, response regulator
MTRLRVLAVDDEVLALRRLHILLGNMQGVDQIGEARGCEEAVRLVQSLEPDVLLLDVQMRDGTGFDVIEKLPAGKPPLIIFVSAFDHYAVRAFETSAIDYVLKPVEFDRLEAALDRARHRLTAFDSDQQLEEMRAIIAALRTNMQADGIPRYETELWIRKNVTGFARVPVDSIDWVCSEDDYVRVHTREASYLMRSSIRSLEGRLDPQLFTRIHRRALVRKSAIREFRSPKFGATEVVLQNGQRLPAGRVYAKTLRRMVSDLTNPSDA